MKNLGIHQSSSVSVLSDAENLSADLAENTQGWTLTNCPRACLISLFVCFKPRIEPYLRQRGCGYVHVTPCCHRQQWRNVWPAPISLGTVSRGRAPSSSRILPPRGLVCQMAAREGKEGLLWACWGVQIWHLVLVSLCLSVDACAYHNSLNSKHANCPWYAWVDKNV